MRTKWDDRISRAFLHTLNLRNQKKDDAIPSTEDIKAQAEDLNAEVRGATELQNEPLQRPSVSAYFISALSHLNLADDPT